MAGLKPWHGPPTPTFVCFGSCFTTALTTTPTQPREALLKYAKADDEDLQWTAAWRINQPKPVFAEEVEEKDEGEGE
jgi:hypothetical protein